MITIANLRLVHQMVFPRRPHHQYHQPQAKARLLAKNDLAVTFTLLKRIYMNNHYLTLVARNPAMDPE